MVATLQAADDGMRKSCYELLDMREGHSLIIATLIKIEWSAVVKLDGHLSGRSEVVARPAAVTYEGRRDQEDGRRPPLHCAPCQVVQEDCGTDRMADEKHTVAQLSQFPGDAFLPYRGVGIGLIRHPRIVDRVVGAERPLEARQELVVPRVMGAPSATLDEQHLSHAHIGTPATRLGVGFLGQSSREGGWNPPGFRRCREGSVRTHRPRRDLDPNVVRRLVTVPSSPSSAGPPSSPLKPSPRHHPLDFALRLFADVRAGEGPTVLLLTANVFLLLTAYYFLKVAREPLILLGGGAEVKSYASVGQSILLVAVTAIYGWLASRVGRMSLIAWVTVFFVGNLVVFWALGESGAPLGVPFFLWVGIFNLVTVAQFWSFAADIYSEEQGKRLFPIIGIGSSIGAVAGAWIADELFFIGPFRHGE